MIFHRSCADDIIKYYKGTFVKFKETGDRLWYIHNVNYDEVHCKDVDGFDLYIDLNEEYEVDYALPGRAVYQCGNQAFMLSRKPAKQYQRGISSNNTNLSRLRPDGKWDSVQLTLDRLQQFVDKPAYQDPDVVQWPEMASIALNPVFSVAVGTKILYALRTSIGSVNNNTKEVMLSNSLFKPEVKKLFPTWSVA